MIIKRKNLSLILLLAIVGLNIGCDQVSKHLIRKSVDLGETISIVKDNFIITKVENTGAFLSAGNTLPEGIRFVLLTLMPILVLSYGLFYLASKRNLPQMMQLGLCFLIGGGIGNVYDRLRYGSVTDFLHLDFGVFRTGVFNLADVSIMIGIGLLFIVSVRKKIIHHGESPLEKTP